MSGYSATKAAQVGFAESLRTEFHGTDIAVSVVLPVSTETEFRPKQSVDEVASAIVACVRRPRAEVYPHASARALTVANALAPGLTDKVVRKYGRRREGR